MIGEDSPRNSLTGNFTSKYGDLPIWSSDSITKCEICLREFTIRRRRHHCRKCGCIVCYKCSTQSIVIPRLGKNLHRVCDSCYNQIHSDPCSDLLQETNDLNIKEQFKVNSLRVAVITTNDVIAQAIVQGISISLTGSPLGKEIDIHCFPAIDISQFFINNNNNNNNNVNNNVNHNRNNSYDNGDNNQNNQLIDSIQFTPPQTSLPSGLVSRHSISPHYLSYPHPSSLHSEQNLSFLRNSLSINHSLDQNSNNNNNNQTLSPTSPIKSSPPIFESDDKESKKIACEKAKLAYQLYQDKFNRTCDYSVGIMFCVVRDESYDSNDDTFLSPSPSSSQIDSFEYQTLSYHIYYWIAIYDGLLMNTTRSASMVLPPSLCAHIHRRNNNNKSSNSPHNSNNNNNNNNNTFSEIDIEEELIAAILRLGEENYTNMFDVSPINSNRNSHFSITHALSGGIVGWLTAGKITRAHYLQNAIQLAFIPFQWKDLYEVTDV